MKKTILIWLGVFVLIIAALFGLAKLGQRSTQPPGVNTEVSVIKDTDWFKGDRASSVVLVEYSDFQCPACKNIEPTLKEIFTEYGDKLVFVYRHFPIYQAHANAEMAGRAAEAAGKQGKFWEYRDVLFEKQDEWKGEKDPTTLFTQYATTLGLDATMFGADMRSDASKESVVQDYQEGTRYNVTGTPTFFLNGVKMQFQTLDEFKNLIKTAAGA